MLNQHMLRVRLEDGTISGICFEEEESDILCTYLILKNQRATMISFKLSTIENFGNLCIQNILDYICRTKSFEIAIKHLRSLRYEILEEDIHHSRNPPQWVCVVMRYNPLKTRTRSSVEQVRCVEVVRYYSGITRVQSVSIFF